MFETMTYYVVYSYSQRWRYCVEACEVVGFDISFQKKDYYFVFLDAGVAVLYLKLHNELQSKLRSYSYIYEQQFCTKDILIAMISMDDEIKTACR